MEFIAHKEELPNFSEVISELEGDTLVGGGEVGEVIALKLSSESCCLVSTKDFRLDAFNEYNMVKQRLGTAGFTEVTEVSAPDDVVELLHTNHTELAQNSADGYSDAEQEFFQLVKNAVQSKTSDIHMNRKENVCEIWFRINGEYTPITDWTTQKSDEVIQVAYTVLGQNKEQTWDRKRTQDTDIKLMVNNKPIKLRYAHSPTAEQDSWHAVFRVISQDEDGALTTKQLGYGPEQIKTIDKALKKPEGLILLVGETGSGKSTTITSILTQYLIEADYRLCVQSIEDPPEYKIRGVIQSPVIRVRDKNDPPNVNFFSKGIRSNMRRDPDILNLGEIRDEETAKAIIGAVQSGHRVVSTLHAPSALSAIERLEDLGVTRSIMASPKFFTLIMFQALIPVLCEEEKTPVEYKEDDPKFDLEFKQMVENTPALNGKKLYTRGSSLKCPNGIGGRTVAAEVVVFDKTMLKMVKAGQDIELEEYWIDQGRANNFKMGVGYRAIDHAVDKVGEGIACPYDVMRKLGEFDE